MKKLILPLLLVLLYLAQGVFAQESYYVTLTVTPFTSKVVGDRPPRTETYEFNSGDSVSVNLSIMTVNVTAETSGQDLAFSFDKPLELNVNGVKAEVQKIVLEKNASAILRTPTKDAGSRLKITWAPGGIPWVYWDYIQSITRILGGEPSGRYGTYEDYSVMFEVQSTWKPELKTLGYTLKDIDGDGTDELLFGEINPDLNGTVLYDLYTIQNGELVHVFDGWDRSRFYLTEDGIFIHQGSSGAAHSFNAYLTYANGELHLMRALIYDGERNSNSPWFISYTSRSDSAMGQPIREDEAQRIMNYYKGTVLSMTEF